MQNLAKKHTIMVLEDGRYECQHWPAVMQKYINILEATIFRKNQ